MVSGIRSLAPRYGVNLFGEPCVIDPTGVHKMTIVWLHDLGSTGIGSHETLKGLGNSSIKWIIPTAPLRPITALNGEDRTTSWCDISSPRIFEGMQDDLDSMKYVNTYVASLLSSETPNVMRGVGGVGLGASQALFYASSYALGEVSVAISIVIAIDGWLPNLKNLQINMNASPGSISRAASIPRILIIHGNDAIPSAFVKKCVQSLRSVGFQIVFNPCGGPNPMNEMFHWLVHNFNIKM